MNWPTEATVANHTIVVLTTLVVLTAFIAVLDNVFGDFVHELLRLGS